MANPTRSPRESDTSNDLAFPLTTSGVSRRSLLRRSLFTAAAVAPLGLLAACGQTTATGAAATSTTRTGNGLAPLKALDQNKAAFTEIQSDENAHVTFLVNALKSAARPKPTPM